MLSKLFLLAQAAAPAVEETKEAVAENLNTAAAGAAESTGIMEFIKSINAETIITYGLKIVGVLLLVWIGFKLAKVFKKLTAKALENASVETTIANFVGSLVYYLILAVVILAILSIFGIETTSVAAVIGAAGLAVGLAFQGTLSNFAAGFMIIFFKPFKVGDVITVDGKNGGVKNIGIFDTTLETLDNRRYIIPNSKIYGSTIENVTANPIRRVDITVGTSYEADITETRKVLESAYDVEDSLKDPAPAVVLTNLNTSSIDFEVRVWCNTGDYFPVRERLIVNIRQKLKEAGIEIPYQQIMINTRK